MYFLILIIILCKHVYPYKTDDRPDWLKNRFFSVLCGRIQCMKNIIIFYWRDLFHFWRSSGIQNLKKKTKQKKTTYHWITTYIILYTEWSARYSLLQKTSKVFVCITCHKCWIYILLHIIYTIVYIYEARSTFLY